MCEMFPGGFGMGGPDSTIFDFTEPIALVKGLEERGCSYIFESTGSSRISNMSLMPRPSKPDEVYRHFTMTKMLKDVLKPETVVIGSAYSVLNDGHNNLAGVAPEKRSLLYFGNYNIEHGITDMVGLGRQSLADPLLPLKYCEGRENEINWCKCCSMCSTLLHSQHIVGCVVHNEPYKAVYKQALADGAKILR